MIRIQAILIAGVFAFLLFKPVVPIVKYMLRKTYIVEKFCAIMNMPELRCNGKCHMNKKLNQEKPGAEEDPMPVPSNQWKRPDFLASGSILKILVPDSISLGRVYINNYRFEFATSVFHPPVQGELRQTLIN